MSKIDELLAVLDMSEDEQQKWWETHYGETFDCKNCLASEAFRLRDEAMQTTTEDRWKENRWKRAKFKVYARVTGGCNPSLNAGIFCPAWFVNYAQPIHWIIAALIAKELTDGNKD